MKTAQIKNNTKVQLAALKLKYAIPDIIKTICGYIAIGSLSFLASLVIVNECVNFFNFLFCKKKLMKIIIKQNNKITPKPVYLARTYWNLKSYSIENSDSFRVPSVPNRLQPSFIAFCQN